MRCQIAIIMFLGLVLQNIAAPENSNESLDSAESEDTKEEPESENEEESEVESLEEAEPEHIEEPKREKEQEDKAEFEDVITPRSDSFSFQKFSGPVSGSLKEVVVPNANLHERENEKIDYLAKPDYSYSYGVHDKKSGNSHTHTESRDGNAVHGEYRVLQSDGLVRIVRYTADATSGFNAVVEYVKT